jgi:lipoprotein-anchoring transpeptidase ErfK/SrfK
MRRLVAIPVKTLAVTVLLLAGAVCVMAEARQVIARRQQKEFEALEHSLTIVATPADGENDLNLQKTAVNQPATTSAANTRPESDELAAERQAAQLPAQKPAKKTDGHVRELVISIQDRQLALLEDGELVKVYPIAVGARVSPSPDGEFVVINHAKDPTYNHKGKIVLPGKDNPLGSRWMGLSLKGYGIHGTNVPSSIGKAASHGCFRMGRKDVEDLYSRVQVGDKVIVRRQHDEVIARAFTPAKPMPAAAATAEVQVASATAPVATATTDAAAERQ